MNEIEVIAPTFYEKTVGPLNSDESAGQVYLPSEFLGEEVLVLWLPTGIVEKDISDDSVLVSATVEGWERKTAYERGTGSGFVVAADRIGDDVVLVPCPERMTVA